MRDTAPLRERTLRVFAVGAAATALAGLVTGLRDGDTRARPHTTARASTQPVGLAPTYADERRRFHPNRLRHPANFDALRAQRPALTAAREPADEIARAAAITQRMERRAYDGAPPTVPHPVAQRDAPSCLVCHRDGLDVAGRVAPAIPHAELGNCLQCHVVSSAPMPGDALPGDLSRNNSFAGLAPPGRGERAWPVAPPTIPHATLMRARCESCHGVYAAGLRSTHPWRQSCTQCHAPSAQLDQRPLFAAENPR